MTAGITDRRCKAWWPRPIPMLLVWFVATATVSAQQKGPWQTPPPVLKLDFTSPDLPKTTTFLDQGLAQEVSVNFVMYRRDRVTIEAKLPEPGTFEVEQTNPLAAVEVRNLSGSPRLGKVEIVLKVKPLTLRDLQRRAEALAKKTLEAPRKAARKEAEGKKPTALKQFLVANRIAPPKEVGRLRDVYVDVRSAELGKDEILAELKRLGEKRKTWVQRSDADTWETMKPGERMKAYGTLLTCDLADEYLQQFGLEVSTTRSTLAKVLATKVAGVHDLLTGSFANDEEPQSRTRPDSLLATEVTRLGKSLTVTTKCHFFPAADPNDPNALWFNGQRVTCLARHVASIRVEGALDPAGGDRVDWWMLDDFNPNAVAMSFPDTAGIRHELFAEAPGPARLRVATGGDKPVTYAFELRPRSAVRASQGVVIYESRSMVDVKFPF